MLKINDDNIYGGYIKQLLASFNLPQCPIGDKDFTKSTYYIEGNSLSFYDHTKNQHRVVSSYKENDKIENVTKNLEIRNNLYDSYTHEYLGDYLRYIRDYKGLNLMSMYNCFSNVSIERCSFEVNGSLFDANSSEYTIFAIPIKFNQKYTIAIDWHGIIEMCCGYYSNGKRYDNNTSTLSVENATYHKECGIRFNHPYVFDKLIDNDSINRDYGFEKDFKLFLKVPTMCKSSIVVLEGDFSKEAEFLLSNERVIINREDNSYLDATFDYKSRPQLLSMNYQETYLIADRLVEYLSNQAITPIDPIINNIRRLQKKVFIESEVPYTYIGIWDETLRKYLYTYIVSNNAINKYYDMLGYVDKDVERTFDIESINGKESNEWQIQ